MRCKTCGKECDSKFCDDICISLQTPVYATRESSKFFGESRVTSHIVRLYQQDIDLLARSGVVHEIPEGQKYLDIKFSQRRDGRVRVKDWLGDTRYDNTPDTILIHPKYAAARGVVPLRAEPIRGLAE